MLHEPTAIHGSRTRIRYQVKLLYDVFVPTDFIFSVHAAETPHQRVLAESAATKDDAWERRGPICWAGLGHPVSVGLQAATKSEGAALPARCQRHRPISSP